MRRERKIYVEGGIDAVLWVGFGRIGWYWVDGEKFSEGIRISKGLGMSLSGF